jgi:hypothetical protein
MLPAISCLLLLIATIFQPAFPGECDTWRENHPEWIFCDDFEDTGALVKPGRYFEYDDNEGDFVNLKGAGLDGSNGMRVGFQAGEVDAGSLKLAFGRNPNAYMNKQKIRPDEDFREIYYRMYLKMEEGWSGSPAKLSRATCFPHADDWGQAMIAHLWSDDKDRLLIDPASCVNGAGIVECATYNDFDNLSWLGNKSGVTPIFSTANSNKWFCVEAHVRLNDPGLSNGVQEFWIDGSLEAQKTGLNFTGSFDDYAINAVFFENYWNSGSVKLQERYFDNIVVSTQPIGPYSNSPVGKNKERRQNRQMIKVNNYSNAISIQSRSKMTRLSLFTVSGKLISDRKVDSRTVLYDCSMLTSGIYPYRIYFKDMVFAPYQGRIIRF